MFLLMQPQFRTLLDSQPGGKEKVKNIQGMFTLQDKFTNRPTIGPDIPTKTQADSSGLTPIDLLARANYNLKGVEKDTQGQKDAAGQLIRTIKSALDLTMLSDAGCLNLYEF